MEKRYYAKHYSSTQGKTETKAGKARIPTVRDVLDYAERHYRKTGEYISYGKAVEMMERSK